MEKEALALLTLPLESQIVNLLCTGPWLASSCDTDIAYVP